MLISENIASLVAREQAAIAKAQARHALISKILQALPLNTPPPVSVDNFGYCAGASLTFQAPVADLATLIALYPPLECVDLTDGGSQTQKPKKYVRGNELHGAILPIYPVVLKASGVDTTARWWTQLADTDVEVSLKDAPSDCLAVEAKKYVAQVHSYSTGSCRYWTPKLAEPVTQPAALTQWHLDWDVALAGYIDCLTAAQLQHLKVLRMALVTGKFKFSEPVNLAEVQKVWTTDDTEANARYKDMWPDEAIVALLTPFIQHQANVLPEAIAKTAEQFAVVKQWFEQLFSTHGSFSDSSTAVQKRIRHQLRKDTKLDVQLRILRGHPRYVCVSAYFDKVEQYPDWKFEIDESLPRLQPQDFNVDYL
ncbi:MAG: hypothetical protein Q7S87_01070 [Agitococcus sp.]|nr:hypothetical protein [Agitococcus sp.]